MGFMLLRGGDHLLPGVTIAGIAYGGQTESQVIAALKALPIPTTLIIGETVYPVSAATLGVRLEAEATAAMAWAIGRDQWFEGVFGRLEVAPIWKVVNVPVLSLSDPVTGQTLYLPFATEDWGTILTASAVNGQFRLDQIALTNYLTRESNTLGTDRTFDVAKLQQALITAILENRAPLTASQRVTYRSRTYTVRGGETLLGLAWKFGIPGWRISQSNPGVNLDRLAIGQVVTIPPKDANLTLPVIADKRIVVSISQQRMWVYERGVVRWEWVISTGVWDSPTMPGVFQILSHHVSAYAGNWDLDMPYFMGIYETVPGFTNGIHGMVTRRGASLLWENALGRPVTYGCILLSNAHVKTLYEWAPEGVVVEVRN
jgi:lipoprotein-anchoring transpeptidase ErfK/SrfK